VLNRLWQSVVIVFLLGKSFIVTKIMVASFRHTHKKVKYRINFLIVFKINKRMKR